MWPLRGSHLTVTARKKNLPRGWSVPAILEAAALTSNLRLPLFLIIRSLDFKNRLAHVVLVAGKVSLLGDGVSFLGLGWGRRWIKVLYLCVKIRAILPLIFFFYFSPRTFSRNTAAWLFLMICLFPVVLLGLWVCEKFGAARQLLRILQSVCFGQSTDSDTPAEPLEIADRRGCTNRLSQCHVCVVSRVRFTSIVAPFFCGEWQRGVEKHVAHLLAAFHSVSTHSLHQKKPSHLQARSDTSV